jgi:hypothetical protein
MFPAGHPAREPRARGQVGFVELSEGLVDPTAFIATVPAVSELRKMWAPLTKNRSTS